MLAELIARALCHRLPGLTPAGLLCYRCLGLYSAVLGVFLFLGLARRWGRDRPGDSTCRLLGLAAVPLVVDVILVTLTDWSPPGWWRALSAAIGGGALYLLLAGGLLRSRRRGEAQRDGRHLEPGPPLLTSVETLFLLVALGGLATAIVFLGGLALVVLDHLALLGAILAMSTAAALPCAPVLPRTARGSLLLALLGVAGAGVIALLLLLTRSLVQA